MCAVNAKRLPIRRFTVASKSTSRWPSSQVNSFVLTMLDTLIRSLHFQLDLQQKLCFYSVCMIIFTVLLFGRYNFHCFLHYIQDFQNFGFSFYFDWALLILTSVNVPLPFTHIFQQKSSRRSGLSVHFH